MAVRSVQAITYSSPANVGQNNSIGWDGKDPAEQFLKLLVSQITNQDPDNPVDATDMITQFAQIQSAIGLHGLVQSSQAFQRVNTAGTLLHQRVTVWDKGERQTISGTVRGVDFSGPMPLVNIDGQMWPLEAVQTVGEI